jgi:hypothetical protein
MTHWGRGRCVLATMLFVTVGIGGFYSSRSSFYGFRPSAGYGYGGFSVPQYSGYWTTPFISTGEIICSRGRVEDRPEDERIFWHDGETAYGPKYKGMRCIGPLQ